MALTDLTYAGSAAAEQAATAGRATPNRRPRRVVDVGAALNLLAQTTVSPASGASMRRHGLSKSIDKSPAKGIIVAVALSLPIWALTMWAMLALFD